MAIYSQVEFEKMVAIALDKLPSHIQNYIANVAVVIEEKPTAQQLKELGTRKGDLLLGLYQGVPETEWGKGFGNTLPDKITIFKQSIERVAGTPEGVEKEVQETVRHEIAHYFGYTDEQLEELAKEE